MANITIPATGSGDTTPIVATDVVSLANYQKIKLDGGGAGASTPIVAGQQTEANSLPVVIASNQTAVPSSVADGADVALGATTDAGVKDATGSVNAHVRGLVQILADVWDSVNHWLKVSIQNTSLAVTQSGSWTNTVTQGTATNLKAQAEAYQGGTAVSASNPLQVSLANTGANATAVKVDNSGVTQPVSNAGTFATQATLQAGTALVGKVSASAETSTIYNGTSALTPSFATIAASTSGASSLVGAVTAKQIRVLGLAVMANGTVNVKFQSHTTPTDETGLFYLIANTGFVLPYNPLGWFQTVAGEQLDINLSGAVAVGGCLVYVAV